MTDGLKLLITGDREAVAAFRKLGFTSGDLSTVFGRIAADAAAEARARAPKLSGHLAGTVKPARYKLAAAISAGSSGVPYAGVQEYGWARRRIAAQPFLRPAADDKAESSAEEIAREIQRLIDNAGLG